MRVNVEQILLVMVMQLTVYQLNEFGLICGVYFMPLFHVPNLFALVYFSWKLKQKTSMYHFTVKSPVTDVHGSLCFVCGPRNCV